MEISDDDLLSILILVALLSGRYGYVVCKKFV